MASTNIPFDRANQTGQEIRAYLQALVKCAVDGPRLISILSHMVDGNGTDVSHFAEMVAVGIFDSTADAKASWDELNSVNGKLSTDASVSSVNAAMLQAAAKHGIV